mgnify:CR=1 FL=1
MTKLQADNIFLDTYIREASLALNTINYIFDGKEAAEARGFGFLSFGTLKHNEILKSLNRNQQTSKWVESSTNYDNHWMALREAHIEWEILNSLEHNLSDILMNLENSPANMGRVEDAEPARTHVSRGFNILPKLNSNDKLVNTFHKYNSKLNNSVFKMTVMELNFV